MRLLLMRHGEAVQASEDVSRPLSARGRADVLKVAGQLKQSNLQIDQIFHSGKTRALETAKIVAQTLNLEDKLCERQGLGPNDPYQVLARELQDEAIEHSTKTLMITGHLPFLADLVAELVCENRRRFVFEPATVMALTSTPTSKWMIETVVRP